ncbi:MAG TPA: hypothetical protein PLE69_05615 [bacterium]|nr:hypothetical protein [bacterium]
MRVCGILNPRNRFEEYYDSKKDFHTIARDFNKHLNILYRMGEKYISGSYLKCTTAIVRQSLAAITYF